MFVDEYVPKGGWLKRYRWKKFTETLKAWGAALFLLAAFAFVGYVERGM